jgi:serine/threonine protein kinase
MAEIRNILLQILNGLAHLHQHGIIHGDLSARNIFFKNEDSTDVVVADFDESIDLHAASGVTTTITTTIFMPVATIK